MPPLRLQSLWSKRSSGASGRIHVGPVEPTMSLTSNAHTRLAQQQPVDIIEFRNSAAWPDRAAWHALARMGPVMKKRT
jgi:hypothetical protein